MGKFRIGFWKDKPLDDEAPPFAEYVIEAPTELDAWAQANTRFQADHPKENRDHYTTHSENAE